MLETAVAKVTGKLMDGSILIKILSGEYAGSDNVIGTELKLGWRPEIGTGQMLKVTLVMDEDETLLVTEAQKLS